MEDLTALIAHLEDIRNEMLRNAGKVKDKIDLIDQNYKASGTNLVHYLTLRMHPLRDIQAATSSLGLSSFTHSEKYTLSNIQQVIEWLKSMQDKRPVHLDIALPANTPNYRESQELLEGNIRRLFKVPDTEQHNIMVTLPTEAGSDYGLVEELVEAGMNVARINCSHDHIEVWQAMITNIERAREATNLPCRIYMDLSGPKIRTGEVKAKKKKKKKGAYIELHIGDLLLLHREPIIGHNAVRDKDGRVVRHAGISITLPAVLDSIKKDDMIWFDDGKIGARAIEIKQDYVITQVVQGNPRRIRLKAEKGINLPNTHLNLPSLTDKDIGDLPFMIRHADILGYSFVRTPHDVELLYSKLKEMGREDIGIVLKIENREAFDNLPQLLLTAMRHPNIGIMIARGDLAIEIGWERIAEVQEEILWLCEAAHIPTIWATQVLEKLAKDGIASRSEITDAAMASRSECVMLNKGPFIVEAVQTLKDILIRMKFHQKKKKAVLRPLSVAANYFNAVQTQ